MDWQTFVPLLGPVMSLIGSGPWGLAGVVAAVGGLLLLARYLVNKANNMRDSADLDQGGAHAGQTATDLRNQDNANNDYVEQQREQVRKDFEAEEKK